MSPLEHDPTRVSVIGIRFRIRYVVYKFSKEMEGRNTFTFMTPSTVINIAITPTSLAV